MRYVLFVISIILFSVYIMTAPPTIYMGDSGEIAAVSASLGAAHPPGYPLYMLMGKTAQNILPGDAGFSLNVFSAACGVLVFILLYLVFLKVSLLLFRSGKENAAVFRITSLAAAIAFVFSQNFWAQAVTVKGGLYVFSAAVFLAAVLSALRYLETKSLKYLYLCAYLCGIGAVSHPSTLLPAFFIIISIMVFDRKNIKFLNAVYAGLFFIFAAFTPYIYLLIRGPVSYSGWAGLNTLRDVAGHAARAVYLPAIEPANASALAFKMKHYLLTYARNYNMFFILALAGFIFLFRFSARISGAFAAAVAVNTAAFIYFINASAGLNVNSVSPLSMYVTNDFYIMNDIIAYISAGIGASGIAVLFIKKLRVKAALVLLAVSLCFPLLNYRNGDFSRKFMAYDHAENILKTPQDNSVIIAQEDIPVFNLMYIKEAKKKYPGITVYDKSGNFLDRDIYRKFEGLEVKVPETLLLKKSIIRKSAIRKMMLEAENSMVEEKPGRVFFTGLSDNRPKGLKRVPYGMLYRFTEEVDAPSSRGLMKLYTIRDFFNAGPMDLYYRDVIARYFLRMAKFAAIERNNRDFNRWIKLAEITAADSSRVLNHIAEIFFTYVKRPEIGIRYLERMMALDPYDYRVLDLLISVTRNSYPAKAVKWLEYYYRITKRPEKKESILIHINSLKEKLK